MVRVRQCDHASRGDTHFERFHLCTNQGKAQDSGDTDSCPGTLCSGFCETPSSDPANCGSCGAVCASGQPCVSGQCTSTTCGSGQTNCNGTCVNLQSNTNNCGSCGTACPSGDTCTAGACVGGAVGQSCTS